jgi:ABC-type uncharacterized transport system substrate-binding protein
VLLVLASAAPAAVAAVAPARLLVVDSYHAGYPWSDGIRASLAATLELTDRGADSLATDDGRLVGRVVYLDTKRHPEAAWAREQARLALTVCETWQPDVVVACDDNAVRHLVVPHLLGRPLPVIYCGVNWDAGVYGLPAGNVTGMVETEQVADLLATLRPHAAGDRVGLLLLDTTTGRRDATVYHRLLGSPPRVELVASYADWKAAFATLQEQVDMLLIKQNVTGARDWDQQDAVAFTAAATRIPTGTTTEPMMPCALVSYLKSPGEQGRWVAGAVRQVLAGMAPAAIPPAVSEQSRVVLNMTLARRLGLRFPMSLIERASFVEELWRP